MSGFVQSFDLDNGTSQNPTLSLTGTTNGNLIWIAVNWGSATITLNSVTADHVTGNLPLLDNPTVDGDNGRRFAHCYGVLNAGGTCTVTLNFSASVGSFSVGVEVNGFTVLDGHSTKNNDSGTTPQGDAPTSGDYTTTVNGDYVVGALFDVNLNNDAVTGSGFTGRITTEGSGRGLVEDTIQGTASSTTHANWTTGSTFRVSNALSAAFSTGASAFQPDEDFWNNPLKGSSFMFYSPLSMGVFANDAELAGPFFGQPDEDYWSVFLTQPLVWNVNFFS